MCAINKREERRQIMSGHNRTRAGGKFTKKHSTVLSAAGIVADIAHRCEEVKKISLSIITSKRTTGSRRRVKLIPGGHALKILVTDGASHQELFVFTKEIGKVIEYISHGARAEGLEVIIVI
jgi:hypothetical protein